MAAAVKMQWQGLDELESAFRAIANGNTAIKELAAATFATGESIMADSKENYVPVDTRFLQSTGRVSPPEIGRNRIRVVLSYGTDYALIVHEDLGVRHPVGQAKYLEIPFLAGTKGYLARSTVIMRDLVSRAGGKSRGALGNAARGNIRAAQSVARSLGGVGF